MMRTLIFHGQILTYPKARSVRWLSASQHKSKHSETCSNVADKYCDTASYSETHSLIPNTCP